jgi:multiple sugar transport system permease protein
VVGGRIGIVARAAAAALVAAAFALPLVFMVSGSLRDPDAPPPASFELVPSSAGFDAYGDAFDLVDLGRQVLNSLVVAALAVPLSVLVAAWAGFAIARLPRRPRIALVAASLAALVVPLTALLVPRFVLYSALGVTDTWVPLVAPALLGMSPLYVLLYAWSFSRLPRELYDACAVEGLTPFAVWRRIAMPLVRPVTAAVAALAFVTSWSSFLEPLVYLFDADLYTVPLGLRQLAALDRTDYPVFLAGAVVATVPVLAAFFVAQRYFLHEHRGAGWLGR